MITIDAIALVFTVVASIAGATYTIAKKLGGLEEKVNGLEKRFEGLEKTILDISSELKAEIKRLEDKIYDVSKSLARIEAEFIKK